MYIICCLFYFGPECGTLFFTFACLFCFPFVHFSAFGFNFVSCVSLPYFCAGHNHFSQFNSQRSVFAHNGLHLIHPRVSYIPPAIIDYIFFTWCWRRRCLRCQCCIQKRRIITIVMNAIKFYSCCTVFRFPNQFCNSQRRAQFPSIHGMYITHTTAFPHSRTLARYAWISLNFAGFHFDEPDNYR